MKPVPPGFLPFIQSATQILVGELYSFVLVDGSQMNFTNLDFDFTYGGITFTANSIRLDGMKFKLQVGIQVDEQMIKASAYSTDSFFRGDNFFTSLQNGILDGAMFVRQRAFWAVNDGRAWVDFQAAPQAVITIFTGFVSEISKIGRTTAEIKVKSPLKYLDIQMPRNSFQASCNWTLYSPGCTLLRDDFTTSYTVVVASPNEIDVTSIGTPTGGDGQPYYQQGRLLFTSGVNNGLQTLISTNTTTAFGLQYPLLVPPNPGDTFKASAGCMKTMDACNLKFSNFKNYRGFPYVPPVHISL